MCHVGRTHGRINMERRRVGVGRRVKVRLCWRGLMGAPVVHKPESWCCRQWYGVSWPYVARARASEINWRRSEGMKTERSSGGGEGEPKARNLVVAEQRGSVRCSRG